MPISGETKNKQSKTLVRGVFVLMPAMLIAKIIGLFYKIPLLSVVGVTGMAYFLSAYHIYALLSIGIFHFAEKFFAICYFCTKKTFFLYFFCAL